MSQTTNQLQHSGLRNLLRTFVHGGDGVYSAPLPLSGSDQAAERVLREKVAADTYDDYLATIAQNHSIPVMDHEVDRFLRRMPTGALVLDLGGCWGWHWRRLSDRPDVSVVIVDFVRANLLHAKTMLAPLIGRQVALLHADATALPFPTPDANWEGFDGVWTVQVFQHIPDFERACTEARRALRPGGRFINYSLYATPLNRAIYRLLGKRYHRSGMVPDASFYLNRADRQQRSIVAQVFGGAVGDRYTECLFHPDLRMTRTGRSGSALGKLDAMLGDFTLLGKLIGRQRSFEAVRL